LLPVTAVPHDCPGGTAVCTAHDGASHAYGKSPRCVAGVDGNIDQFASGHGGAHHPPGSATIRAAQNGTSRADGDDIGAGGEGDGIQLLSRISGDPL
jgi:hypothetical protein